MESLVDRVYPLLADTKTLDSKVIKDIVSTLRSSVSADEALAVLRATVARWQLKTKGAVPFDLEAAFEGIVYGVFSVDAVALAGGDCISQFYSLFCRSVKQVVVNDLSGAVVALSKEVADVAEAVEAASEAASEAVVAASDAVEAAVVAASDAVVAASDAVEAASEAVVAAVDSGTVVSEVLAAVEAGTVVSQVATGPSHSDRARRYYARKVGKFVA